MHIFCLIYPRPIQLIYLSWAPMNSGILAFWGRMQNLCIDNILYIWCQCERTCKKVHLCVCDHVILTSNWRRSSVVCSSWWVEPVPCWGFTGVPGSSPFAGVSSPLTGASSTTAGGVSNTTWKKQTLINCNQTCSSRGSRNFTIG